MLEHYRAIAKLLNEAVPALSHCNESVLTVIHKYDSLYFKVGTASFKSFASFAIAL